ncbi:unannotated protein [freshwater metagenome]|uniref:Unannotated protein n=1 Tax=freshwater metagenome TaxID=449393 RepID=A0A6J6BTL8_9ZZZZ
MRNLVERVDHLFGPANKVSAGEPALAKHVVEALTLGPTLNSKGESKCEWWRDLEVLGGLGVAQRIPNAFHGRRHVAE